MTPVRRRRTRARHPSFTTFVRDVCAVRLTPAQRVLALVAFDGVQPSALPGPDRELALELFGQVDHVPDDARAVVAALCGARSGKSFVLVALYSLWRAVVADLSSLAAGEHASALIVAPDLRLSRQALRFALGAARAAPALAPMLGGITKDRFVITREDGRSVAVECLPAARGGSATRGRSLVSAALDECCFFRSSDDGTVNDTDVFESVTARVMPGGAVVLASTAWAETGLLWSLLLENKRQAVTALACTARTETMRAGGAGFASVQRMIARERARDEDSARREYDCIPLGTSGGTFFSSDELRLAKDPALALGILPGPGVRALCGIDPALVSDSAAGVVLHQHADGLLTVAELAEMRPAKGQPLALDHVVQSFARLALAHDCARMVSDVHMLSEIVRHARPLGVQVAACPGGAPGKQKMFVYLRDLIRSGKLRFPATGSARLLAQLAEVRAVPTSGGQLSITSPRRNGAHGDMVSALAHACWSSRQTDNSITRALRRGSGGHERTAAEVQRAELANARKDGAVLEVGGGTVIYGTPAGAKVVRRMNPWSRMQAGAQRRRETPTAHTTYSSKPSNANLARRCFKW